MERAGAQAQAHTRRAFVQRALAAGLGAAIASARPLVVARAASTPLPVGLPTDATLQAFADTMVPGRKVAVDVLGGAIDPRAIAGVDAQPGAVEAGALELYHHPEVGFDALEAPFLADLTARSLPRGGDFLDLPWDARVQVCIAGLDFSNPDRVIWEAAAAVPFTAFCAAALIPEQSGPRAVGYEVMGLPGVAPRGYRDFSYRRRLSRERTRHGYLA